MSKVLFQHIQKESSPAGIEAIGAGRAGIAAVERGGDRKETLLSRTDAYCAACDYKRIARPRRCAERVSILKQRRGAGLKNKILDLIIYPSDVRFRLL